MPKPLNVLILEDNPADAELLLIELRRAGYELTWQMVDNEKGFTAHLKPELDVILSDYSLPQFSGLQALKLRNESGYDIPFILVSGAIGEEIAVECMREGAADYLFKDRLGRLGMAVDNAIKEKRLRDQKQQAEQTLQESEEYLKTIFETTSVATIVIEEDTTLSVVNKEFENLSGYSKEELEGKKSWTEFVAAEDLKRVQEYHRQWRIDSKKILKNYEFRFINKKGGFRDIFLRVDMIPGTKTSVASLLDVTERKRAQQEIEMLLDLSRQSGAETDLDSLLFFIADRVVDVIPPAEAASIFLYDKERGVIKIQAWAGFDDSEIKGLELKVDGSQAERILRTQKPIYIENTSEDPDYKPVDKSGIIIIKSQIAVPLIYKKRVIGVIFADNLTWTNAFSQNHLDLLESIGNQLAGAIENACLLDQVRESHKDLLQSEERFRAFMDNLPAFAYIKDESLCHIYSNQAGAASVGKSLETYIGTRIGDTLPPEVAQEIEAQDQRVIVEGNPIQYEFAAELADGNTHWILDTKFPIRQPDGSIQIGGFGMDVTERKRAQQEIETLLDLSRQSGSVTSMDELLFFIAGRIVEVIPSAEASSIFFYDKESEVIKIKAWAGYNSSEIKRLEFKVDNSLGGRILRTKKPALINDVSEDSDYKLVDKPGIEIIKSQIAVPLIYKKRVIGIVFADNLTRTSAFSQKDLDFLESIGNQLAGVIENARLLDQVREDQRHLRQSEQRYRSVVEDSPLLICRFLPDGTIAFVNQEYRKYFGNKNDELIGKNMQSTVLEEDREKIWSDMALLSTESPIFIAENKNLRRDGKFCWIRWTSRALFDDKEQLITYQAFGEDITERKLADEKLQESEENFRLLAENSIDCIWLLDTRLRFTYISPSSETILGYRPEQMVGTKLSSYFKKREFLKVSAQAVKAMANYKTSPQVTFETKMLNSKNEEVDLEIAAKVLVNSQGRLIGLQGATTDITERVQAREKDQRHVQNITFLTETAMKFVDFPPEEDIYRFVGEQLRELVGKSIVVINSIDQAKGILTTRAVLGLEKFSKEVIKLTGRDPVGLEYDAKDENLPYLSDGDLHDYEGGLYGIFLRTVPKSVCRALEKLYRLNKIYTIGFVKNNVLFGNVAIFLPRGAELENKETIKTFVKQASIAIQRKQAEQALQQEQERAQKYLDIAEVIMLAINKGGEVTLINQKGNRTLGYQEGELLGKNWADTCLPERNREEVRQIFKKTITRGDDFVEYYENPVLTRSGEERIIAWRNTLLWDEKGNGIGTLSSGEDITQRILVDEELNLLLKLTQGIIKTPDFNSAIEFVLHSVCEAKNWAYGEAWIPGDDGAALECLPVWYSSFPDEMKKFRQVSKEIRFPANTGLPGRVRSSKLYEWIPDVSITSDKIFLRARVAAKTGLKAALGVPIIAGEDFLAVLVFFISKAREEDHHQVELVSAVAAQLGEIIQRKKAQKELRGTLVKLKKSLEGTIRTVAATVEVRDSYTAGHQERVSDLAAAIANQMGLAETQVEGIRMAGLIHDLGKINVPAEILSKPGKLSELEFNLIKTHPQVGYDLLKKIEFPWPLAQVVLQHHEKMDGSGYPQGLKGAEILLEARILGVADIVEAMSTHRPYRPALGLEKALEQIRKDRGTLLDSEVVDACLKVFEQGYKLTEIEGMFKVS